MNPRFSITNKMLNLILEITQKVTFLELEKERNLLLRKTNRLRSIHSSLAIEQNTLTFEQVSDIINGKRVLGAPQEIQEVQNAFAAYELVFQMNPYSIDDFLLVHKMMTKDLVKENGAFRQGDVAVYDGAGNIVHVGARPQFIYDAIVQLFDWAKADNTPDLIKSCIVHFEIEMIHPFSDGNGRMGRLWQNLILSNWQEVFEWIPIETIVCENQQAYYDMLALGNKKNDATQFIEFMLEVILETVEQFGKDNPQDKFRAILTESVYEQLTNKELTFLDVIYPYLSENDGMSSSKAMALTGRPAETVRRYFLKFVDLGMMRTTGENKNRKYILVDTLK